MMTWTYRPIIIWHVAFFWLGISTFMNDVVADAVDDVAPKVLLCGNWRVRSAKCILHVDRIDESQCDMWWLISGYIWNYYFINNFELSYLGPMSVRHVSFTYLSLFFYHSTCRYFIIIWFLPLDDDMWQLMASFWTVKLFKLEKNSKKLWKFFRTSY